MLRQDSVRSITIYLLWSLKAFFLIKCNAYFYISNRKSVEKFSNIVYYYLTWLLVKLWIIFIETKKVRKAKAIPLIFLQTSFLSFLNWRLEFNYFLFTITYCYRILSILRHVTAIDSICCDYSLHLKTYARIDLTL